MHILLIHQAFTTLDDAGGTRHIEFARHLAKHGHRITIISSPINYLTGKSRRPLSGWKEKQELEPGIIICQTYTYPFFHRSFLHRLLSFVSFMVSSFLAGINIKQVDLIWGTSPPIFQSVTAWLLAKIKKIPFVLEIRDLWPAFAIAMGVLKNPILIKGSQWLESFLYKQADQVIVNSPGYLEHVTKHGARRVQLVPNGADPAMFSLVRGLKKFPQQMNLEGRFIVTYAGAHGPSNDLGVVLRAAEMLKDHKDICFLLVGDGKEKKALQNQAKQLELENIKFIPPVPKLEMNHILAASDACIAILKPLEWYKTTYPNKVFDYMAAGRPVVLAIDGVIREVVENANAGIFVQPGNPQALAQAILFLYKNPERAQQLGENGRNYVIKHYDRGKIAEQFIHLLEEMVGKNE